MEPSNKGRKKWELLKTTWAELEDSNYDKCPSKITKNTGPYWFS